MDTSIIRKAGLTESQAKGYLALVEHGALAPVALAKLIGESRTNGYMICEKLSALGLANKRDGLKTVFVPAAPLALKKLLVEQQRQLKLANEEINSILPSLTTQFHLNSDAAGVLTLEGVGGINTLYNDILRQGHNLSIIASTYDRSDPLIEKTIDEQIAKQVARGIESRALYPVTDDEIRALRKQGIHARNLDAETSAQVIIYGQTIAISTFKQGMITSVINHPDIAQTFQSLFDVLWAKTAN